MKKKLVLIFATLMCVSLCACGGSESTSGNNNSETKQESSTESNANGDISPEQVVDAEISIMGTVDEIDYENLQKYYDTTKFIGEPRALKARLEYTHSGDTMRVDYTMDDMETKLTWELEKPANLVGSLQASVTCIVCDNNTPDDYEDDTIAYIFMPNH